LDYIVRVEVQRFDAETSQQAQLLARWELKLPQSDQLLASHSAEFTSRMTSLSGDAAAAALSEDVGQLAEQIASSIQQAQQQRLARDGIQ
jgi:uncharacterized lipoprotein YmbA